MDDAVNNNLVLTLKTLKATNAIFCKLAEKKLFRNKKSVVVSCNKLSLSVATANLGFKQIKN